jgi:RNA polymerase primary sigma factor
MANKYTAQAMRSFDPEQGANFRSWNQTQLQRLSRPIRQSRFSVRVPDIRAREAARVKAMVDELEAELGQEPSDEQVADRLGVPLKRIKTDRRGTAPEVVTDDEEDGQSEQDDSDLVREMVYHSLDPKDQLIMEYAFGYNGSETLPANRIANKLKVSPAAVSQRMSRIRKKLDEANEVRS